MEQLQPRQRLPLVVCKLTIQVAGIGLCGKTGRNNNNNHFVAEIDDLKEKGD